MNSIEFNMDLEISIIFIHMGEAELPLHTYDAIHQARLWNPHNPIFLISETCNINNLPRFHHIPLSSINKTPEWNLFNKTTNLNSGFRQNFFKYAAERIFVLHAFMTQYGIDKSFHLENDNLLYLNINDELKNYESYPLVATRIGEKDDRLLLNAFMCNDVKFLGNFCEYLATTYYDNEMKAAYSYWKLNPDRMYIFPHNPNLKNCLIMDAAAIGQYLGGPDPRNINKPENSINPGFCNEGLDFDIKTCNFEWKSQNDKKYPTLNGQKIGNLHIHCKNLKYFIEEKTIDTYIKNYFENFFPKSNHKMHDKTLCNVSGELTPGLQTENGIYTHINYYSIKKALETLIEKNPNKKFFTFVETGCSAHGTKSTLIWDSFVDFFDGKVLSVDIDRKAVDETNKVLSKKSKVTCSDSLVYLPTLNEPIDFLYLDSYDVDYLNSKPSAEHHLNEFNCIRHLLHENSIVLIDDTPVSPEWIDDGVSNSSYEKIKEVYDPKIFGKGGLVNQELEEMKADKILHQYQTLWVINKVNVVEYDCVIPYGPNDQGIVNLAIEHARKNLINLRNIYVVSYDKNFSHPLAITIDETTYPFNIQNVREILTQKQHNGRYGWYLQQLLKMYAYKVIPDLSEYFLILDSDTLFLKPTLMFHGSVPLYNTNDEYNIPYFKHMYELYPILRKMHPESGICHHMLFKQEYLDHLMEMVETFHQENFWKVFLQCANDLPSISNASEYEIYFAYLHIYQQGKFHIRKLNNRNLENVNQITSNLDYVSIHHYMRQ